jgi:hypothetical protein
LLAGNDAEQQKREDQMTHEVALFPYPRLRAGVLDVDIRVWR